MIDMKEITLASFINEVIDVATERGQAQLMSFTKKIAPLSFLDAFDSLAGKGKERLFWMNHTQDFKLFGIGSVRKIVAHENRYRNLQKAWEQVINNAYIHNPFTDSGTGLTAIGGMSFDPLREKSVLWRNFPTSQLTIPAYLLVYNNGNYYFTVNRYIDGNDQVQEIIAEIETFERKLHVPNDTPSFTEQSIVEKKEIAPERWKNSVAKAVAEINAGRAQKIVLARELRLKLNRPANIGRLLAKLTETQPNSYIFAYEQGEDCFIGATPERLVQVEKEALLSTCLAGTAPRGKTAEEDKLLAEHLLQDTKNRKEHEYVVQMIKSQIEPFCDDIHIPDEPVIYPLRNLQHLFTPVTAMLKPTVTVFDLIEALHPTPALGGVPKDEALAFIRKEELLDRGWYGAPIGWVDSQANSEFAVAIRSGLVQGDEISLFAGCGVMGDSDPEMEYEETNVKFLPMLSILED